MTLAIAIGLVAMVYAAVGHGGASGYLAVASLLGCDPSALATTALLLNLVVATLAWLAFRRAGHFSWSLTWPFVVTSMPAAMVGGWLPIAKHTYYDLLGLALLAAAARLWIRPSQQPLLRRPALAMALPVGAGLGVVSGVVGVGGGIFLSPLLVLCGWADAKRTAGTSAAFIVLNSASGLLGRALGGRLTVGPMLPLAAAALLGGLLGSRVGASHLPNPWLCRVLGAVLGVAALKLLRT
jgi:uncharacterized membrane protein YfcA